MKRRTAEGFAWREEGREAVGGTRTAPAQSVGARRPCRETGAYGWPTIFTGWLMLELVVPSPSWPLLFEPQQYASPLSVTPQAFTPPTCNVWKVRPPETIEGVGVDVAPQHHAAPAVVRPQLY